MSNVPDPTPGFRATKSAGEDPLASFGSEAQPAVVETPALVPSPPAATAGPMVRSARPLPRVTERRIVFRPRRRLSAWLEIAAAVALGVVIGTSYARYFDTPSEIPKTPPPTAPAPTSTAAPAPVEASKPPAPVAAPFAAPPVTLTTRPSVPTKPTSPASAGRPRATNVPSKTAAPEVAPPPDSATAPPAVAADAPAAGAAAVDRETTPPDDRAGAESGTANDTASIRMVLDSYKAAYEKLDPLATAALWPSVDTRALNRAFGTLSSQNISFDRCDITVDGARGTARCNGVISYVRRVGDAAPQSRPMAWAFVLDRSSGEWRIANVSAK